VNGSRQEVAGKFILRDKKMLGLKIAAYDKSKALIIDPVINFGTLLSASVGVSATGVAEDGWETVTSSLHNSNVVPGTSADNLNNSGAAGGGSFDVSSRRFLLTVLRLAMSAFVGSSANDSGLGIALDATNNAFITGFTPCTTTSAEAECIPPSGKSVETLGVGARCESSYESIVRCIESDAKAGVIR